jgi:hypothetical protein
MREIERLESSFTTIPAFANYIGQPVASLYE